MHININYSKRASIPVVLFITIDFMFQNRVASNKFIATKCYSMTMETPTLVRMLIKAGGPHTDGNIGMYKLNKLIPSHLGEDTKSNNIKTHHK